MSKTAKIESVNNELIKKISKLQQKKYRDETGLFIVEGKKAVEEALKSKIKIEHVFSLENFEIKNLEGAISVNEKVMKKISSTETPPTILAVCQKPKYEKITAEKITRIALFENIKDVGNLGSIIRSACAFSIEAILLTGDTVDIYNPKTIRSAAGNFFKIPVINVENPNDFKDYNFIATVVKNGKPLQETSFKEPFVLMFGSEAEGLSEKLLKIANEKITIKMKDDVDSLNLSVSASIVFCYANLL